MAAYLTPGVYYERVDASTPAITSIRTDVAGFVGLATRGPVDTAMPIESWRQFEGFFGSFTGTGFLAYAVRGFFENGGKRCWVVRVASKDPVGGARPAVLELPNATGTRPVWSIAASSPGVWGNELTVRLEETHQAQAVGQLDRNHPERLSVNTATGFSRFTLVRLTQPVKTSVLRVVAAVDTTQGFTDPSPKATNFLVWSPGDPSLWLPYNTSPLDFDPDRPIVVESVEYTLVVEQLGVPVALYRRLSLIPRHPNYGPTFLDFPHPPTDVDARRVLPPLPQPVAIQELRSEFLPDSTADMLPLESIRVPVVDGLTGGSDGLTLLTTYDLIGEPVDPMDSDEVKKSRTRGLRVLQSIDEVSILAVPDIQIQPILIPPTEPLPPCVTDPCLPGAPPEASAAHALATEMPPVFSEADIYRVQAAMVQQCEDTRTRVALLDPPFKVAGDPRLGIGAVQTWRSQFDSSYAAFYFPWLRVVDPLRSANGVTRDVPPCGHVAGQYAATDLQVGVHKAPANASLAWAQDVTVAVNTAQHGVLNPRGINAIRPLTGRGIRIFGARTVSSDPDWRFINVRRLMIMVEKAIYLSSQWAVFEPIDQITQAKLRLSLSSFLIALWERGALAGDTADAAFFVRCDDTTSPPDQRAEGRLLALVGVAPANPLEFVVVRVGRTSNELEISELGVRAGVQ